MNTSNSLTSKLFYKNVDTLMQSVKPSKELEKLFKEGMFDKPNTEGFIHVSHYLLNIYNQEYFEKNFEWPLLEKRSEAKYRNNVKDFLVIIAEEHKDLEFPKVLTSHLMTAGGKKFLTMMFKLSQAALKAFTKRIGITIFNKPKASHPLAKILLTNSIARRNSEVHQMVERATSVEDKAKEEARNMIASIEECQQQTIEEKQKISLNVSNLNLPEEIKKRLLDSNDDDIINEWKRNIKKKIDSLKEKSARVEMARKKSCEVNSIVKSLYTNDKKLLDGKNVPVININNLVGLLLEPQAQTALENLYQNDILNLNNMFTILSTVFDYLKDNIHILQVPHLPEINQQLVMSIEDLKVMQSLIETINVKIKNLSAEIQIQEASNSSQIMAHSDSYTDDIFEINLFKNSPIARLKIGDFDNTDVKDRLQLTPVDHPVREFFPRYARHAQFIQSLLSERSKIRATRINFDETLMSTHRNESLDITRRPQSSHSPSIEARVGSRMANLIKAKRGNLSNLISNCSQWRTSSILDISKTGNININNMYDERANISSICSINNSVELSTPSKSSLNELNIPVNNNIAAKNIGLPVFNSTVAELMTIVEASEESEKYKKTGANEKQKSAHTENITTENNVKDDNFELKNVKESKGSSRRLSINDLVERYKKIREQAVAQPDFNINKFNNDDDKK